MTLPLKTPDKQIKDPETVRREVLTMVDESKQRLTPGKLKKQLCENNLEDASALKAAVRDLVLLGELKYTYQFGCSFIEKSYDRPIRVSKRVVLKPPDSIFEPACQDIVIEILKGASFGFGDHPTTRLAIRGIEAALSENRGILTTDDSQALDIGTGSGVLAIAAVLLGIQRAVGIDIDPCARTEAKMNVQLNGLEHRIAIFDTGVEDIQEPHTLITANLRYPTLRRLCVHITGILQKEGAAVLSGITANEVEDLLDAFARKGFQCMWKADEKGWVGMVLKRSG